MKTASGSLIPVRTAGRISKAHVFDVVEQLRKTKLDSGVIIGDEVLRTEIDGEDIRVVATQTSL